ncbi:MAG: maleylpyruvate isomerase family mycothiol-dependent enzyme, partial [Actinomycetota bacterium]|nr:maleylpyruvate isomerase family mycothiol-dependent enzyme [Actinomycetota bacterium]
MGTGAESARALARQERRQFADLLAGLTDAQWDAPSLCSGWSVRDVAAHTISYLDQSLARLTVNMIRARGDVDRLNARLASGTAGLSAQRLVELMARDIEPAGAAALYGGRVALIECLVHQQDIRRPLGLERGLPPESVRVCLDYARVSPVIGGARRTRGTRLVGTDVGWVAGRGPEVCGTGEALLLAVTGRLAAVRGELSGP